LWQQLRAHRFYGLQFKRQVQIGNYIVDFCCRNKKLIIELDGGQHSKSRVKNKDLDKEKFLRSQGYQILRFWNNEVDKNLEGVLGKVSRSIN
jgi:very-short-patch-repair endonuclease